MSILMNRYVSTRTHGDMDLLTSATLIAVPFLMKDENRRSLAAWIPAMVGVGQLAQSVLTDYERGAVRRIPMRSHLISDAVTGALLAASPWLLGFARRSWLPHLLFGMAEIGSALLTRYDPNDTGDDTDGASGTKHRTAGRSNRSRTASYASAPAATARTPQARSDRSAAQTFASTMSAGTGSASDDANVLERPATGNTQAEAYDNVLNPQSQGNTDSRTRNTSRASAGGDTGTEQGYEGQPGQQGRGPAEGQAAEQAPGHDITREESERNTPGYGSAPRPEQPGTL